MRVFASALMVALASVSPVWGASFTPFAVPTGPACGYAIAPDGVLVGAPYAPDVATSPPIAGPYVAPFMRGRDGTVSSLSLTSISGAPIQYARPTGINAAHTIVGYEYYNSAGPFVDNFKLKSGKTTTFGVNTEFPYIFNYGPAGISNSGIKIGNVSSSLGPTPGVSTYADPDMQTSILTFLRYSLVVVSPEITALDSSGTRFVGQATQPGTDNIVAFAFEQERVTVLPLFGTSVLYPRGIDGAGRITGTYQGPGPDGGTVGHGFVLQNGVVTTLDAPGATDTFVTGLNDSGQFTGCYTDSAGLHAYLGQL